MKGMNQKWFIPFFACSVVSFRREGGYSLIPQFLQNSIRHDRILIYIAQNIRSDADIF